MYKAKISKVLENYVYEVEVPSLAFTITGVHQIGPKGGNFFYQPGDLVIIDRLNDGNWVVVGYVYGQK